MRRSRMFPHPLASVVLLIIWLILNTSLAPGQVLLGILLGWAIPWLTHPLWRRPVHLRRPLAALSLLLVVLLDIVLANLNVARLILGPRSALRPAFVSVPLQLRDPYAIWALASIITLTPGTVSALLSEDRRSLLVHALDVEDPAAVIAQIRQRYETPLKEIFE